MTCCVFGGFSIGHSGLLILHLRSFFPQIQLWCRIQATASQSHFLRMALPFQWQLEILMRRNEASQGGATRWRPRYLLQMFTRDGSRCFVDERSFKLDHHK